MYYLVTINYEIETERNTKLQKIKYIIEAESVEEAAIIANKYIEGDTRSAELLGITHMPIECVIGPKTYPEYYKEKNILK
jgi:hypothetical protein